MTGGAPVRWRGTSHIIRATKSQPGVQRQAGSRKAQASLRSGSDEAVPVGLQLAERLLDLDLLLLEMRDLIVHLRKS